MRCAGFQPPSARACEHVDSSTSVALCAVVALVERIQQLAASALHVCEAFETLVRIRELRRQRRTTNEAAVGFVLGDESAHRPVEVCERLDQAQQPPAALLDRDVLEADS